MLDVLGCLLCAHKIGLRAERRAGELLRERDMAKGGVISHQVVEEAVERKAHTIVYGDIRNIADGIDKGAAHNQRMSQWNHGKVRAFVEYKAEAEGIRVVLQNERNTSKTCPQCGHRHKPRGRTYVCPSCRFRAHRDVVGQVNILSAYLHGEPGKIPAPAQVKYRIPQQLRVLRKCQGTGQPQGCSLEKGSVV